MYIFPDLPPSSVTLETADRLCSGLTCAISVEGTFTKEVPSLRLMADISAKDLDQWIKVIGYDDSLCGFAHLSQPGTRAVSVDRDDCNAIQGSARIDAEVELPHGYVREVGQFLGRIGFTREQS